MAERLQRTTIDPDAYEQIHTVYIGMMKGKITFKDALDRTDMLRSQIRNSDHTSALGYLETILGIMYGYQQDYRNSLLHFDHARRYYQSAGDEYRTVVTIMNMAETYRVQGNTSRARRMFHEAHMAVKDREEWVLEANAMSNEALILIDEGNSVAAKAILDQALEASLKHEQLGEELRDSDWSNRSEMYYGLARIDMMEVNYPGAWKNAKVALELAQKSGMNVRLGQAYRTLAQIIADLGHAPSNDFEDNPDVYFEKARQYFDRSELDVERARTLTEQGHSLARRNNPKAAYKCYTEAFALFARRGLSKEAADTAEARSQLSRMTGRTKLL